MIPSILQDEEVCFLCGGNGIGDPLNRHHIFQGKDRKASDDYGLWVYLCHNRCHQYGPYSAHQNSDTRLYLEECGEKAAIKKYGWDKAEWLKHFSKNYLSDDEIEESLVYGGWKQETILNKSQGR